MKVCIFGAGAIGGHIAARIALGKHRQPVEVSVVARGAHLKAIQNRGLTLLSEGKELHADIAATDNPAELPAQDLVVVTLKAPSMPALAPALARMTAPQGAALFVTNGLPWWWHYGLPRNHPTAAAGQGPLKLLDPDGALWEQLGAKRALGGVVYSANEVVEPGVVRHRFGNQWTFGEPDGSSSQRLANAVEIFQASGMATEASNDIRRAVWKKLLSNSITGPVSALTRLDAAAGGDPGVLALKKRLLGETLAVAAATGWDLRPETDLDAVVNSGAKGNRSSMLQDVLAGRPMEVEAFLGQMQAFARELKVATPNLDVMVPLLRGLDLALREQ